MGIRFSLEKSRKRPSRRLALLPRIGIYIDIGGYEFVAKYVPLLESLMDLEGPPYTREKLVRSIKKHFSEVVFPTDKKAVIVDTKARKIN